MYISAISHQFVQLGTISKATRFTDIPKETISPSFSRKLLRLLNNSQDKRAGLPQPCRNSEFIMFPNNACVYDMMYTPASPPGNVFGDLTTPEDSHLFNKRELVHPKTDCISTYTIDTSGVFTPSLEHIKLKLK